jgi:V/A-type H+-transporting ATPase subunit A
MTDVIYSINGPVVTVLNSNAFSMREMVYVGERQLLGEVIRIDETRTTIQVYETTTGLRPGEPVKGSGTLLCATLGPGILRNIYDGIERPLQDIAESQGAFIAAGRAIPSLNEEKKWDVTVKLKKGDRAEAGAIFATCQETSLIEHRSMIPYGISGVVVSAAASGSYTVNDTILTVELDGSKERKAITLKQEWAIRNPRPITGRQPITTPLITGQRVLDTMFPIAKGGSSAIPGGFGAGKTMLQHQYREVLRCRYHRLCWLRRTWK